MKQSYEDGVVQEVRAKGILIYGVSVGYVIPLPFHSQTGGFKGD